MVKLHTSLSGTWPKTSRPRNPWGPPGFWRVGKRMTFMSFFFYGGGWKVNALFGPSFWDFLGAEKGSGYVIICFLTEQFLHLGGEMVNSILSSHICIRLWDRMKVGTLIHLSPVKGCKWSFVCGPHSGKPGVKQNSMPSGFLNWLCKTNNYEKKTGDFDSQDLHMGLSASMVPPNPMVDQQFPA